MGEKVGNWFDDSGITRKVVDTFSDISSNVSTWASNTADTIKETVDLGQTQRLNGWELRRKSRLKNRGLNRNSPLPELPRTKSR